MIRRTLRRQDGTVVDLATLPEGTKVGRGVRQLADAPEQLYLPDPMPPLDAHPLTLLRKRVYLLGESHDDGSWERRTGPWPHIPKLLEREKSLVGQDPAESAAIREGIGVRPDALEDMSAYLVTQATLLQNHLGNKDFDEVVWRSAEAVDELKSAARQVQIGILDHIEVVRRWMENMKRSQDRLEEGSGPARRFDQYVAVVALMRRPEWVQFQQGFAERPNEIPEMAELPDLPDLKLDGPLVVNTVEPIASPNPMLVDTATPNTASPKTTTPSKQPVPETLPFGLPGPKARAQIQAMLQELVATVLALLDTRTISFSGFGLHWRSGDDPIPNRSRITDLSRAGSDRPLDVLAAANPMREAKMVERIVAKPAPLLVKVGDQHVDRLVGLLRKSGLDPIPVRKTDDFNAMLSVGNRSD